MCRYPPASECVKIKDMHNHTRLEWIHKHLLKESIIRISYNRCSHLMNTVCMFMILCDAYNLLEKG